MNVELTEEQKIKIRSDRDLYPIMREILLRETTIDLNKEHFWCAGLASNNRLLYIELVSLGTLSQSIVEPMDVFAWAIHKQVSMLILIHNHPSGELKPTNADLELTDQLIQVGRIIQIPVVDHLIISIQDYYSFERQGDLKRLQMSKKYVPGYIQVREIKEAAEKIGEERGEKIGIKKGKIEMAKKSLKEGLSIELISKLTGLSEEEIEAL